MQFKMVRFIDNSVYLSLIESAKISCCSPIMYINRVWIINVAELLPEAEFLDDIQTKVQKS